MAQLELDQKVFVVHPSGLTLALDLMRREASLTDVKQRLEHITSIPQDQQCLSTFENVKLESGKKLAGYDISKERPLRLRDLRWPDAEDGGDAVSEPRAGREGGQRRPDTRG